MVFRRLVASIGALSVLVLGIGVLAARESGTAEANDGGIAASTLAENLSQLDLSPFQRARIDKLFGAEERRLVALRDALGDLNAALRRAELEQPFDEDLVSSLVAEQAELSGYVRGAESRLVSSIAVVLNQAQRDRFAELRIGALTSVPAIDGLQRDASLHRDTFQLSF